METLRVAKKVGRANGMEGFYLDVVTAEVLGILEDALEGGRRLPGALRVSTGCGTVYAQVRVDIGGSFYVPLRKGMLEILGVCRGCIDIFEITYMKEGEETNEE